MQPANASQPSLLKQPAPPQLYPPAVQLDPYDIDAELYPTVAANAARSKRSHSFSGDDKGKAVKRARTSSPILDAPLTASIDTSNSPPLSNSSGSSSVSSSSSSISPSHESKTLSTTTTHTSAIAITTPPLRPSGAKLTSIPQELQIEIFSHTTNPHNLRLVNRSFHQISQLAITKALWLLHRYPYYKVLERSLRYRFFDVQVAKTLHTLCPNVFCSRYYVRKAVLKLDKEKYRYRAAKKILQHFILLTGKRYFGLDVEDDTHFPLGKSLGDDHAMDLAIRNRQWAIVQSIGSLDDGYGYWTHAPFARDSLSRLLEEAPFLVSTLHHDAPPRDYISALRTCLYMLSSIYPTNSSPSPPHSPHPYTNKHLVRLALQSHHPTIYRPVLDKIAPALTSRDKQAIMDDVAFDTTDDGTLRELVETYRFPMQYGCSNERPLFALAWHNMHPRIHLFLTLGFDPRLISPTTNFLYDLLCAENTSLELYMTLLDAGTPLEPSTMRKIIAENLFDGVLLGYILKHWERCETRVGWEVVVDMMVSFRRKRKGGAKSLVDWRKDGKASVEKRERRELEKDEKCRRAEKRRDENDADADDEGAEQEEDVNSDEDEEEEDAGRRMRRRGIWGETEEEEEDVIAEAVRRAEDRQEVYEEVYENMGGWRWREELDQG